MMNDFDREQFKYYRKMRQFWVDNLVEDLTDGLDVHGAVVNFTTRTLQHYNRQLTRLVLYVCRKVDTHARS